ncbi:hypothetical protein [Methanococcoides sp. LMO-2]|uniref:Uncharacterized protein n=1 Tax=Methanococcoides cohabitans TaxID=3136559 RepID=A0ABU9KS96_9EURY
MKIFPPTEQQRPDFGPKKLISATDVTPTNTRMPVKDSGLISNIRM